MFHSLWQRIVLGVMIAALLVWTLTGAIPALGVSAPRLTPVFPRIHW